jgi:hypothetical protein
MTTPRHVLRTALVLLVLGVSLNVGLAWAALLLNPRDADVKVSFATMRSMRPWPQTVPHDWPAPQRTVTVQTRWSDHIEIAAGEGGHPPFPNQVGGTWTCVHFAEVLEAGVPLRSLRGIEWQGPAGPPRNRGTLWAVPLGGAGGLYPPLLPLKPVWPGFLINTLLYTALAASLWSAPGLIRRARRHRAGHCLTCGYARAGLPDDAPCPECGSAAGVTSP